MSAKLRVCDQTTQKKPTTQANLIINRAECNGHTTKRFHPSRLDEEFVSPAKPAAESETLESLLADRKRIAALEIEAPYFGLFVGQRSNAQALDFVSLVVADNAGALRQVARGCLNDSDDERTQFWCACLSDAITAACEAARRARWEGLRSAPTVEEEKAGKHRPGLLLPLPSYAGAVAFGDADLLRSICSALYVWRGEIQEAILPSLFAAKRLELEEALCWAERSEYREGSATEIEVAGERNLTSLSRSFRKSKLAMVL